MLKILIKTQKCQQTRINKPITKKKIKVIKRNHRKKSLKIKKNREIITIIS